MQEMRHVTRVSGLGVLLRNAIDTVPFSELRFCVNSYLLLIFDADRATQLSEPYEHKNMTVMQEELSSFHKEVHLKENSEKEDRITRIPVISSIPTTAEILEVIASFTHATVAKAKTERFYRVGENK